MSSQTRNVVPVASAIAENYNKQIMRKILLIIWALACLLPLQAQTSKKTRHTAQNTKEAEAERKISGRFNKGLRNYYTAQYEEAMQVFSSIIVDAPKHAPSYFMIAKVHTLQEHFSEAENALKQAVKYDKDNIWYQEALAESYIKTQNYKEALPLWEKICAAMPDNEIYLHHLYECYSQLNKPDKVAEIQRRLEELAAAKGLDNHEENQTQPMNQPGAAESHAGKGQEYLKTENYALAVDEFAEALRLDDSNVEVWQGFVTAVQKSQKWSALVPFEEALTTMFPQSPDMLAALADAFLHTSQPEKAVEYYQQALLFSFDPAQQEQLRQSLHTAQTR